MVVDELLPYDRLTLARMCEVHSVVTEAYRGYRFNVVYRNLYDYVTELSNGYLNATKDRVYCGQKDGADRRSALTVWAQILSMLVHDLQPILCFTCDEVMAFLPESMRDGQKYAALLDWYQAPWTPEECKDELAAYAELSVARDAFTKAFEEAKAAGAVTEKTSQGAKAALVLPHEAYALLAGESAVDLSEVFVCSEVSVSEGEELSCSVAPADGQKCPRCWNYRTLGADGLCCRCHDAVAAASAE